jgi:hypothetical protein
LAARELYLVKENLSGCDDDFTLHYWAQQFYHQFSPDYQFSILSSIFTCDAQAD